MHCEHSGLQVPLGVPQESREVLMVTTMLAMLGRLSWSYAFIINLWKMKSCFFKPSSESLSQDCQVDHKGYKKEL